MIHTKPSPIQTYTLREVAEYLQLSQRTLYQYVHQGKLKGYKFPSGWRFTEKDVMEFITLHQARATRITTKTEKKK
jgi:excisionase family DNA binding protein